MCKTCQKFRCQLTTWAIRRFRWFYIPIFGIAPQFQRLMNELTEIFLTAFLFPDIFDPFPSNDIGAVNTVSVAFPWTHQTVCRHQDTSRKIIELFLLILPCSAKISDQMRIFFQAFIAVSRKHFSMSINIHTGSCALLQQHFQIMKIMSGNNNKRTCFQRC